MSNDGMRDAVSDQLARNPWIQGPQNVEFDTGTAPAVSEWPLIGKPNMAAQEAADAVYFANAARNVQVKDVAENPDRLMVMTYDPEPVVLKQGTRMATLEEITASQTKVYGSPEEFMAALGVNHIGPEEFEDHVSDVFAAAEQLLIDKHKAYGPLNIAQAPGGPLNGLRVRMWDKFARINNLIENDPENKFESLRDSFMDMANYALIAMLVIDGNWPGVE